MSRHFGSFNMSNADENREAGCGKDATIGEVHICICSKDVDNAEYHIAVQVSERALAVVEEKGYLPSIIGAVPLLCQTNVRIGSNCILNSIEYALEQVLSVFEKKGSVSLN